MARRNKGEERTIARERIARLVQLAEQATRADRRDRADRYAQLAWLIKTRYQARGTAIDGRICRKCKTFHTSATARVRVRDGRRVVTCLACGAVRRRVLARRTGVPAAVRAAADG